jgi:periplasmic protein TonB
MKPRSLAFLTVLLTVLPVSAQPKLEPPVPVRTVAPEYPFELRREGVVGLVLVSCVIDEQGNVTELAIEKTTNVGFNAPALEALKKWKFKPARIDGNPVAKKVVIPLRFNVQET